MRNKNFLKIIVVILTIVLIAILLSQISTVDVINILEKLKPVYLVLGFVLYALSYFFKSIRFHILLNREISIRDLFFIVSVHNMAVNIFPARSGELSYIYMLKKRHDKNVGEGAATLLAVRIFDMISISILFLITVMLAYNQPDIIVKTLPIVSFFLLFVLIILFIFIYKCDKFVVSLRNLFIYLKLNKLHFINYIFRKLDEMAICFKRIHRTEFFLGLLLSAFVWTTLYLINYILIIAMGINLPLESVLLASSFFFMISILPIQGVGGFGTLEGSWAISFMAIGTTKEAAISSGFLVHIIQIFYLIALFLIGFLWLQKKINSTASN